jgi:alpha-glucosidase
VQLPWWSEGVIYQIYPRSFADSNADGIGDLSGIESRLDYLEWLGVDGIWLNPIMPSPNADWGYDVSDYLDVHPDLGTLDDLDRLVAAARDRGIRVLLDLVPNHTSDRHAWFEEARSERANGRRTWYVWSDPKPDGSPPNNWLSAFGGPAWTLDERSGQYYHHGFLPEQPDLNWWNADVREEFDRILRFWFDRGVAGFRIDVAHRIVKDEALRDNPPATEEDHPHIRRLGQKHTYTANQPELHEVLRHWRQVADSYHDQRVLLGEAYVLDHAQLAAFYGAGLDELHLAFNFIFVHSRLVGDELRSVIEASEAALPEGAWPVWTGSNHDAGRFATRWCGGDPLKVRAALVVLLTLRGTPVLYYGDEIGMSDVPMSEEQLRDPAGLRAWPEGQGRDPGRTPMQWTREPSAGFTTASPERAWLPLGHQRDCNVADQRADPDSVLTLCRDLIALRRSHPALASGSYCSLATPPGVWAYRRGDDTVVAVNLSERYTAVDGVRGEVLLSTDRERDGEDLSGQADLRPWEGLVIGENGTR